MYWPSVLPSASASARRSRSRSSALPAERSAESSRLPSVSVESSASLAAVPADGLKVERRNDDTLLCADAPAMIIEQQPPQVFFYNCMYVCGTGTI